mmetsp:Transcript_1277/g.2766  ORF Transcript_1277/g.2766 Transcript_1277/m.2766 type:complete len:86 (+) Transcript_1277:577-834(+)
MSAPVSGRNQHNTRHIGHTPSTMLQQHPAGPSLGGIQLVHTKVHDTLHHDNHTSCMLHSYKCDLAHQQQKRRHSACPPSLPCLLH